MHVLSCSVRWLGIGRSRRIWKRIRKGLTGTVDLTKVTGSTTIPTLNINLA